MTSHEKILVIIDPSEEAHPALDRAIANAKIRQSEEGSHLLVLITPFFTNSKTPESNEACRSMSWATELLSKIDEDISYETLFNWSTDWSASILKIAHEHEVDMVMLPFYSQPGSKARISDEKWALLRKCESPVLLIRPENNNPRKSILVSVKVQDDSYEELNKQILKRGEWAANRYGADLHAVNAYTDSMSFPDRNMITRFAKLDNQNIHFQPGEPEKVIAYVADKIKADMILIGTKRRSGIKAALRGNTIEKIIGNVSQDIMLMV